MGQGSAELRPYPPGGAAAVDAGRQAIGGHGGDAG